MKNKRLLKTIILLLSTLLLFTGCKSKEEAEDGKPIISVSILPQKYFLKQIAGNLFNIHVMVPPGASPATYELAPGQMKKLAKSEIYFQIGHIGFEEAWMDRISLSNETLKVFDTSEGIELIAGEEFIHGDHVHLHGVDPHVWMSVSEVRKISKNMLKVLVKNFPQHRKTFYANMTKWENELESLYINIGKKLQEKEQKNFLIFHPALTYFARDYGLVQHSLELDGKNPSPQHLSHIVNVALAEDIHVVFIQKEFYSEQAETLAKEINGTVIQIDPLAYNWPKQLLEITSILDKSLR